MPWRHHTGRYDGGGDKRFVAPGYRPVGALSRIETVILRPNGDLIPRTLRENGYRVPPHAWSAKDFQDLNAYRVDVINKSKRTELSEVQPCSVPGAPARPPSPRAFSAGRANGIPPGPGTFAGRGPLSFIEFHPLSQP